MKIDLKKIIVLKTRYLIANQATKRERFFLLAFFLDRLLQSKNKIIFCF